MTEPIKPEDIVKVKGIVKVKYEFLSDKVIETFNELIVEKWDGSCAVIKEKDIMARIKKKFKPKKINNTIMSNKDWPDIEDTFEKAGWSVYYDNPGPYEFKGPRFEFRIE